MAARAGATVSVVYRSNEAAAEALRAELPGLGVYRADASDEAQISAAISQAMSDHGAPTALVQAREARQAAEQAVQQAKVDQRAQLAPYQQQVEAVRATFRQAQSGVKQGSVKAPISGTVLRINAQAGQEVGADAKQELVRIVDLGAIKVVSRVSSDKSTLVEEGKNVALSFREIPNKVFDGRVSRVRVLPGAGGTAAAEHEITIDFKNDEGVIKDGFTVEWVGVKVGEVKDVLTVPVGAVDKDATGKPIVRVLVGEQWTPRVVETGLSDGRHIEIKSGVEEGETVQVRAVVVDDTNKR
jgi:RND family efflux transporter MFP subunit